MIKENSVTEQFFTDTLILFLFFQFFDNHIINDIHKQ